jgi:hypothetical protein
MTEEIIGKWVQAEGQAYQGLWFQFNEDHTFRSEYEPMGIVSGGRYEIDDDQLTFQQTEHTLGFTGEFKGRFKIEEGQLTMAMAAGPGKERPKDLSDSRLYIKEQ